MYIKYRILKGLGNVSINLDGMQPELHRKFHDEDTEDLVIEPRVDVFDVDELTEKRAILLEGLKDLDALLVDIGLALDAKASEMQEPPEMP